MPHEFSLPFSHPEADLEFETGAAQEEEMGEGARKTARPDEGLSQLDHRIDAPLDPGDLLRIDRAGLPTGFEMSKEAGEGKEQKEGKECGEAENLKDEEETIFRLQAMKMGYPFFQFRPRAEPPVRLEHGSPLYRRNRPASPIPRSLPRSLRAIMKRSSSA